LGWRNRTRPFLPSANIFCIAAESGNWPRQPLMLQNRSGNRTSSFSSMFRVSPAGSRMPSGVVTAATNGLSLAVRATETLRMRLPPVCQRIS